MSDQIIKELAKKTAELENKMIAIMDDAALHEIAEYTRQQLAVIEAEIARRKQEQEGGFAV